MIAKNLCLAHNTEIHYECFQAMSAPSDVRPAIPDDWGVSQILSLKGKVAMVTGANSGLGYETASQLARKGAHVVLACRDEANGLAAAAALDELLGTEPERGSVQFLQLDVSDLKSVREFAKSFKRGHDRLDLLINNAGVMGGSYALSVDGYERLFATNHLGHFALTSQLFELLKQSTAARVVNVSSGLHKRGEASFDEDEIMVTTEDKFGQIQTYGKTKLCNILFTMELDRRIQAARIENVMAVSCHPGYVATNLGANMAAANTNWLYWLVIKLMTLLPGGKSPEMGALPTLYAATGNEVVGGDYIGPKDRSTGSPARHMPSELCNSESAAKKLWAFSEKLANLTFVVEK
ncbi:retinol dehydrogenase, putative [Phytophthora infestans T30-4]|uniref:Retinol dehydrogenase, putative n=2 Tax=Phytophthora infestans TaxID=4787 RepID=D0P213_PHYIT|nr:retinol dehydrogenase, putative [Phytophthora infestans T30-4]EEY55159.1 retinol dehydrogenase, putative [Phytophthora infestans T30-4]|eukprot:XP_002895658.1 retinol dehydrogenase, putative [Phytophthora infestans T30-4]